MIPEVLWERSRSTIGRSHLNLPLGVPAPIPVCIGHVLLAKGWFLVDIILEKQV